MTEVEVTCRKCRKKFFYDEPSPLHMSHKDPFMLCVDCENPAYKVFRKKYARMLEDK